MKINVVTVRSGWILQKIAQRICANAPEGVEMSLSHAPEPGANNFYVDVTNCYRGRLPGGKHVGLFTHVHENNMTHVQDFWFTLDHMIHMSALSYDLFYSDVRYFSPLSSNMKMSNKMPGEIPKGFHYQKPTIGIFQRGKHEGKGFNLMMQLAEMDVVKDFKWVFAGNDWQPVINKLLDKTEVMGYCDSNIAYPTDYLNLYRMVDYVLIPSKWEGGPMSLIEASALGKEIIAPAGVGWVSREIPVPKTFVNGDAGSLRILLNSLVYCKKNRRKIVEDLSYDDYASYVVDVFKGIK